MKLAGVLALTLVAVLTLSPLATSAMAQPVLAVLRGANFNSTADQAIPVQGSKFDQSGSTRYIIRKIIVTGCSASLTLAAGGVYTATSKGGTPVVASTQIYSALTGSTKFLDLTLAAGVIGDHLTAATLFLSLTTAQGSAATCDVYLLGDSLP